VLAGTADEQTLANIESVEAKEFLGGLSLKIKKELEKSKG